MAVGPATPLRRGANDVVFTPSEGSPLRLKIFRDKNHRIRTTRRAAPAEEGQQPRYRETAKVWRDWRRGAGFAVSDEGTDGGYSHGSFLSSENRGLLGPSGYYEEIDLTPASGVIAKFNRSIEFGGHLYLTGFSTRVMRIPNGTGTPEDSGAAMPGATSADLAIFGDKLWVANEWGAPIYGTTDGTTWTAADASVKRSRFATTNWVIGAQMSGGGMDVGKSYPILVGTNADPSLPNTIYHCSDDPGVAGSWVGPNDVGPRTTSIQRLLGLTETVFACKPEGVYMIVGGGRMPNLTPWWQDGFHHSNGATASFYDGQMFANTVQNWEMFSPDPSRLGLHTSCQPGAYESFEDSPVFGRPTASMTYDDWLMVAFWNPILLKSYVMKGKRAETLGMRNRSPMIWYGPVFECPGIITHMRIVVPLDTAHPRYIYYCVNDSAVPETTGTPRLWRQHVPRSPSPYAAYRRGESGYRSAPVWSVVNSAEDLGDPDAPKVSRFYGCVAENLGGGNSVTISTSTDTEASVQQAVLTTSPRDYAVADTTSARGHLVTVTATVQNDADRPVFIRAEKLRGTVNDEKTTVITLSVELGRATEMNNGTQNGRDSRSHAVQLYGFLEQGPFTFNNWLGNDMIVTLEDVEEDEVSTPDGKDTVRIANLTLSVMLTIARYGSAIYGGSRFS